MPLYSNKLEEIKMTNTNIEILEAAKSMGFTNWLNEESNRGWFTCEMTGKKFRGEIAQQMLAEQKEAMEERQAEIKAVEEFEEMGYQADADFGAEAFGSEPKVVIEGLNAAEAAEVIEFNAKKEKMDGFEDTMGVLHADGTINVVTERLANHLEEALVTGKSVKTVMIKCEDCNSPRQIKVQDKFQVTRCEGCQKKHRNRKRAERRRQQRAEAKAAAQATE
jgi:hypothetical protein